MLINQRFCLEGHRASFNARMRDELLDGAMLHSFTEVSRATGEAMARVVAHRMVS